MPGIVLSIVVAAIDLGAAALGWAPVRVVTKPLVALVLAALAWGAGFRTVAAGLVAAALGDELLLNAGSSFFLAGMLAFVTMHSCYIAAFWRMRLSKRDPWQLSIVSIYIVALLVSDWDLAKHAGPFAVPLVAYSAFLAMMASTAFEVGPLTALGGAVFVTSDTLLAFAKFSPGFPLDPHATGLLIDASYFAAQILIVAGLLNRKRAAT